MHASSRAASPHELTRRIVPHDASSHRGPCADAIDSSADSFSCCPMEGTVDVPDYPAGSRNMAARIDVRELLSRIIWA